MRLTWMAGVGLTLASYLLLRVNLSSIYPREINPTVYISLLWAFSYLVMGAIILNAKPGHRVGMILMGMGTLIATYAFTQQYAVFGMLVFYPTKLPGAELAGWIQRWGLYLVFPAGLALPYLVFPDGRLPSRRWRPVLWITILLSILQALGPLFTPGLVWADAYRPSVHLRMVNPTGSQAITNFLNRFEYTWFISILIPLVALIAPISRFQRARGLERQQLKWLAYSGILILILFPLLFFGFTSIENEVSEILYVTLLTLILPATIAVAIVRNQLYDIDLLINRTLVYGTLTLSLAMMYLMSVVLLQNLLSLAGGQQSAVAVVLSTLAIAAVFSPLRRRIQNAIDRRFYRRKYNAERTLAAFAESLREPIDQDALAATFLGTVEQALQPSHLSLWMRDLGSTTKTRPLETETPSGRRFQKRT
ncbi:MAG TPA: hypothetical protein VJ768_08905 [Anaerolineales bacterium]|nr:hypothetical protein [Anaerolineales bacterium]